MKFTQFAVVLTLWILSPTALASGDQNSRIVLEIAKAIDANYVYPELGTQAAELLVTRLEAGEYDKLTGDDLAQRLRADLIGLTNDRHFGVRAMPEGWTPPSEADETRITAPPAPPHGFMGVQRLEGNIGYIQLDEFNGAGSIESTLDAAMRLVQGSDALIFDLRNNGGGDPQAVALISSYLFDPQTPVHLNSLYSRPDDTTTEYWTHDQIDTSLAIPDTPVYVLTSNYTFSAAEEFSYNLKNLKRATIIGETTGGGAHPVDPHVFRDDSGRHYMLILPTAKAVSPITGTNWEGVGVAPDVSCTHEQALDTAMMDILTHARETGNEAARFGLANLKARLSPLKLSQTKLAQYPGDYTDREIKLEEGRLLYRRKGNPEFRELIAIGDDEFVIDGLPGFIMSFARDSHNNIDRIVGNYEQGHTDESVRSGG